MHRSSDEDDGTWVPDSPQPGPDDDDVGDLPPMRHMPRGVLTAIDEDSVEETETAERTWMRSVRPTHRRRRPEMWAQLKNLEDLFEQGFINEVEYQVRSCGTATRPRSPRSPGRGDLTCARPALSLPRSASSSSSTK